ncbi:hypothetical protein FRC10_007026 [Ceratobasidium sp. 414]|nr:hypothetical protein FRC10_007026 [Ceratobasidium sp. 414]
MSSPTKQVPLAPGSDDEPRVGHPTTRAFFCGVVVEGAGEGELAQDVQELVASLGEPMPAQGVPYLPRSTSAPASTTSLASLASAPVSAPMSRSLSADAAVLSEVVTELVTTERSYLKRLCMLKSSYADPLRSFAKTRDTSIIDAYAAKTLFGNVDQLIPAAEAFLADLEAMLAGHGPGVGEVAVKHPQFRDLRAFDCYKQYYTKREEAQQIFEREMAKKSSTGFASYIDRIKYSTSDPKNRVGLRELLMEPVQRIPRYTLLFRTMIKHMPPSNPQRALLMEADTLASRIALAETDDPTRRAAVMHCLERSVESFPPGLISSTRVLVDCIDVVDMMGDSYGRGSGSGRGGHNTNGRGAKQAPSNGPDVLHATLFLFDDKLMICKRNSSVSVPGRTLAGLDETEKVAKVGLGLGLGFRKALGGGSVAGKAGIVGGGFGLSCRGVVDVGDLVATDVGGAEIHMYLEDPPRDQPDRWNGRSFRALTTLALVPPASSAYGDPFAKPHLDTTPDLAKARFLENLWAVQARLRTRLERSIALYGGELEVGPATLARTWWNLYSRTAFLSETKKPKVVVHIDAEGTADPLPFGMGGPGAGGAPYVVIRVQPIAGELCRFAVSSCNEDDEREEDIVHTPSVPGRIVQTIHRYGLFKFRTGHASAPGTPTRPRTALFSLDTLSFGSMTMANRRSRSRSVASRNSTLFSSVSGSTATSATSEDGTSVGRKLMKRSWSPGPGLGMSVVEGAAAVGSVAGRGACGRSSPLKGRMLPDEDYDAASWDDLGEAGEMDVDTGEGIDMDVDVNPDTSEYDLTMRLELARKNSKTQQGQPKLAREDMPDVPPLPTVYSRPSSPTKLRDIDSDVATISTARQPETESVSTSRQRSVERRPMGPRSPTPRSPDMRASELDRARTPVEMERATSPTMMTRTRGTIERAKSPVEMERARIERAISTGPRPISPGPGNALSPPAVAVRSMIPAPVARKPVPAMPRLASPPPTMRAFSPPLVVTRALSPTPASHGPGSRAVSPALVVRTSSLNTGGPSRAMSPVTNRAPTPLAWGRDSASEDSEPERSRTPPKPVASGHVLTTLRTEPAGGTPMPVNARRRMPFGSTVNTPPPATVATPKSPGSVAPLSIQKKSSLREGPGATRKAQGSPKSKTPARAGSLVRVDNKSESSRSTKANVNGATTNSASEVSKKLFITAGATKEDVLSSRRAVKRIKIELDTITSSMARPSSRLERVGSMIRSPVSRNIAGKVDSKFEGLPSIVNRRAMFEAIAASESSGRMTPSLSSESMLPDGWSRTIEEVVADAERHLMHAEAKQDQLIEQIKELQNAPATVASSSTELERLKGELQRTKGQCELVKKLLMDATAENEIMYETFTEELGAMFADVNLREDQALVAMAEDLRKAKIARNDAVKESAQLKRKLAEMEVEKQHYEDLLRRHGLIS